MNHHHTHHSRYFFFWCVFVSFGSQMSVWSSSLLLVYFCGSVTAPPAGLFKKFPSDSNMPFNCAVFKFFSKKTELGLGSIFNSVSEHWKRREALLEQHTTGP